MYCNKDWCVEVKAWLAKAGVPCEKETTCCPLWKRSGSKSVSPKKKNCWTCQYLTTSGFNEMEAKARIQKKIAEHHTPSKKAAVSIDDLDPRDGGTACAPEPSKKATAIDLLDPRDGGCLVEEEVAPQMVLICGSRKIRLGIPKDFLEMNMELFASRLAGIDLPISRLAEIANWAKAVDRGGRLVHDGGGFQLVSVDLDPAVLDLLLN